MNYMLLLLISKHEKRIHIMIYYLIKNIRNFPETLNQKILNYSTREKTYNLHYATIKSQINCVKYYEEYIRQKQYKIDKIIKTKI
jgi:hypothetical protein